MIEAKNLEKYYGKFHAVKDASFTVRPGEIVGLLGPNGAGKTSIMKILTGYHFSSGGTASVGGWDVSENPLEVKAAVGYLPESSPVYGEFTVEEYLRYVIEARNIPAKDRVRAMERAVHSCGLEKVYRRGIGNLSKGYRQRTGLAQAIIHDPPILILDEPTAGLDPNQILEIRKLIKSLGEEKTVILSTHILQEVEALCDRILILNEGLIAAEGTRDEIASRLKGDERYRLTIRSADPLGKDSFSRIPGFLALESFTEKPGGIFDACIAVEPGGDGGEAIFDWAVERGCKLTSLVRERYSLEDLFSRLTGEEAADA